MQNKTLIYTIIVIIFSIIWSSFRAQAQTFAQNNTATPEAFIGTFMPHGLDGRSYVDENLDILRSMMQICYEDHLRENSNTTGMMLMHIYVSHAGEIINVEMTQNRTGNEELAMCVETSLESAILGPNDRNNVSITLPVTFRMRYTDSDLISHQQ